MWVRGELMTPMVPSNSQSLQLWDTWMILGSKQWLSRDSTHQLLRVLCTAALLDAVGDLEMWLRGLRSVETFPQSKLRQEEFQAKWEVLSALILSQIPEASILLYYCPVICFFLRCWTEKISRTLIHRSGAEKRDCINPERSAEGVGS